jgi:hypothetical protein
MANDYGACHVDRDVTANKLQFACGKSPEVSGSDDPTFGDYYGDTHFGWTGREHARTVTFKECTFRTQADCENFIKVIQSTTGTMRIEWQVSAGVSAGSMFKMDGSNTTLECLYMDHVGVHKASPGFTDTVFKIKKVIFRQAG